MQRGTVSRDLLILLTHVLAPCDHEFVVKIILIVIVLVVVAASVFADYKWRQWMAAHRKDRQ